MKKAFLLLLFPLLNACATYTSGYLPSVKEPKIPNIETRQEKPNLTFSIGSLDITAALEKKMIKEIKEFFQKTHLFNKIHFVPLKEKGPLHMHIDIIATGTKPQDAINFGLISGYTLTAIPVWINTYMDINMFFYVEEEERLSLSVAEKEKAFIWLPLIIVTPFFNPLSVESRIREKAYKYFLNAIIEEKLYE